MQRCEEYRLEEEHGRVALRDALRDSLGYGGVEKQGEKDVECGGKHILIIVIKDYGLAVLSKDGHDSLRIA